MRNEILAYLCSLILMIAPVQGLGGKAGMGGKAGVGGGATASGGALAHDADSISPDNTTTGTTFSWSHTVTSSGSNHLLVCGINVVGTSVTEGDPAVTYNGVSLTKIADYLGMFQGMMWIGYLYNPATGLNTVSVTATQTFPTGSALGACTSFTGANATQPDSTGCTNNASTGTTSCNVTTVQNNAWTFDLVYNSSTNNVLTASQTIAKQSGQFQNNFMLGISYNGPITPAGSTADSWANGQSGQSYSLLAVSIAHQ